MNTVSGTLNDNIAMTDLNFLNTIPKKLSKYTKTNYRKFLLVRINPKKLQKYSWRGKIMRIFFRFN